MIFIANPHSKLKFSKCDVLQIPHTWEASIKDVRTFLPHFVLPLPLFCRHPLLSPSLCTCVHDLTIKTNNKNHRRNISIIYKSLDCYLHSCHPFSLIFRSIRHTKFRWYFANTNIAIMAASILR